MFGKKKNKKKDEEEIEDPEKPREGQATGLYRLTMEELDRNLVIKRAARSSAEKLVENADSILDDWLEGKKDR